MEALDVQEIKLEYEENQKNQSTRVKLDMSGGDLNKVFEAMESLLSFLFDPGTGPFDDWKQILSLFTSIHVDLARLSKYWGGRC